MQKLTDKIVRIDNTWKGKQKIYEKKKICKEWKNLLVGTNHEIFWYKWWKNLVQRMKNRTKDGKISTKIKKENIKNTK